MRILVVSNLYPPYYIGGYELGCQDVVGGLKARGHDVRVLTSTYGVGKPLIEGHIYRWLEADFSWKPMVFTTQIQMFKREVKNIKAFKWIVHSFKPDLVYIWRLKPLSVSIPLLAQRLGLPVCYFVFDNWLSEWESDPWYFLWSHKSHHPLRGIIKKLVYSFLKIADLIPFEPLDLSNVQFATHYLKRVALQSGKKVENADVIYWGLNTEQFPYKNISQKPTRLLYVGHITRHKGVHTAIGAMKRIVGEYGCSSAKLSIVGPLIDQAYIEELRRFVRMWKLEKHIRFMGFLPHEKMPSVYREHDILIFPSIWEEPFGITILEAMSSGLAVVATARGGSAEILENEVNSLIFLKEDERACADQIMRLLNDTELFEKIRRNGRQTVEEKFCFERMITLIENSFQRQLRSLT